MQPTLICCWTGGIAYLSCSCFWPNSEFHLKLCSHDFSVQTAGTLWELHDLVGNAKGNSGNCLQLDAYGQDILRVFDAEGAQ